MHRNLDRRVETLVRVPRESHVEELGELLELAMAETTAAWHLSPDGTWLRRHLAEDGSPLDDLQEVLIARAQHRKATAPRR